MKCFVFDNRVSVNHDLSTGSYELCKGCKEPISKTDKQSDKYELGVSCPNCINKRTDEQKTNSRERQKQIELFEKRGFKTPFDKLDVDTYNKFIQTN